jgi:TM2 domain-containing membrane protein YozV
MSTRVSQVKYWLEGETNNNSAEAQGGARFLSYEVFLALSVFGGFLALDHLYLRSPLTFLAKLAVNVLCFGLWWVYDALQAVFNTKSVKIYGLGVPGFGPKAIGAGVLASDIPDAKHLRFFIYAVCLFFGGIFGLDSFLVGDPRTGIIRILCFISLIFIPIALLIWGYKVFMFFTNTQYVIEMNAAYFGSSYDMEGRVSGFLSYLIDTFIGEPIVKPITRTIDGVTQTVDKALTLGTTIVDKASLAAEAASKSFGALPGTSLYKAVTAEEIQKAKTKLEESGQNLKGGGLKEESNLNVLPYTLLGTFSVITLLGLLLTLYRSKNVSFFQPVKQYDDIPPEPGVFRESDSKKSSSST